MTMRSISILFICYYIQLAKDIKMKTIQKREVNEITYLSRTRYNPFKIVFLAPWF